jgi:hypothetical protein
LKHSKSGQLTLLLTVFATVFLRNYGKMFHA